MACKRMEQAKHLVHVRQHVRFRAAERGKSHPGELLLELAQIVLSQPNVVDEIDSASGVRGMDGIQRISEFSLLVHNVCAQARKHANKVVHYAPVPSGDRRSQSRDIYR